MVATRFLILVEVTRSGRLRPAFVATLLRTVKNCRWVTVVGIAKKNSLFSGTPAWDRVSIKLTMADSMSTVSRIGTILLRLPITSIMISLQNSQISLALNYSQVNALGFCKRPTEWPIYSKVITRENWLDPIRMLSPYLYKWPYGSMECNTLKWIQLQESLCD